MGFSFSKGSHRNTECYVVRLNGHTFGISYRTVVGYWGPLGEFRRDNEWGPTTGRHMMELGCHPKGGGRHMKVVSEEEMDAIIRKATTAQPTVQHVTKKFQKRIMIRALSTMALRTFTSKDGVLI